MNRRWGLSVAFALVLGRNDGTLGGLAMFLSRKLLRLLTLSNLNHR